MEIILRGSWSLYFNHPNSMIKSIWQIGFRKVNSMVPPYI